MRSHRLNCATLAFATLLVITTVPAALAIAAPDPVVAAIDANDVTALETLAKSATTAHQRSLAAGALLALHHEDTLAIAALKPLIRSGASPQVRASAYLVLSKVFLVDQRYRDSYSAIRAALRVSPHSVGFTDLQTMAFVRLLSNAKPMRVVRESPGSLPITRDQAGLLRVPVKIDGQTRHAIADTGAAFSTMSASTAKAVGLQMLRRSATVRSATERAVATRIGIARRLQIGDTTLANVVFIVLPDAALRFPHGYRINAIIGLPVLMALERLEVVNSRSPVLFYDIASGKLAGRIESESSVLLSGLSPVVLARIPRAVHSLTMKLDSGANVTTLNHNAIVDAPVLRAHSERHVLRIGGAGGDVNAQRALQLPELTLVIGGRRFILKNVAVSPRASVGNDGTIGEDILRQGSRWELDFRTMKLMIAGRRSGGQRRFASKSKE
jgi:predicted aspartyl protease